MSHHWYFYVPYYLTPTRCAARRGSPLGRSIFSRPGPGDFPPRCKASLPFSKSSSFFSHRKAHVGSLRRGGASGQIFVFHLALLTVINRDEEALKTLAYYHADGNADDPLITFEFEEIKTSIENEKIQKQTGWLQLFRTPGNRRRMRIIIAIAFFSQWSGNGLV